MKKGKIKIFATIKCKILKQEIQSKLKGYLSGNYVIHFVGNSLDSFHLRDFGADAIIDLHDNHLRFIPVNSELKNHPFL